MTTHSHRRSLRQIGAVLGRLICPAVGRLGQCGRHPQTALLSAVPAAPTPAPPRELRPHYSDADLQAGIHALRPAVPPRAGRQPGYRLPPAQDRYARLRAEADRRLLQLRADAQRQRAADMITGPRHWSTTL